MRRVSLLLAKRTFDNKSVKLLNRNTSYFFSSESFNKQVTSSLYERPLSSHSFG